MAVWGDGHGHHGGPQQGGRQGRWDQQGWGRLEKEFLSSSRYGGACGGWRAGCNMTQFTFPKVLIEDRVTVTGLCWNRVTAPPSLSGPCQVCA